ncbi:MAG: nucleotidyltransferase family protein [Sulfurovum sp.]|nr:nucleotidyltransferase family protein [Sulfurovum sp.]
MQSRIPGQDTNNQQPTIKHQHPTLSPKLQFLIACCQAQPDLEMIGALMENGKWKMENEKELLALASKHGVLPLVYKTLKTFIETHPHIQHSAFNIQHWKSAYMQISQRNMLMSAELIRIMRLFKENGIEALAFKGPLLSQMAYGDITLRQYGDLDILVDEADAFRAGALMSENGHRTILPLAILSNRTCLHTAKDFSLISEPGGVHTELHWRLFEKKYNIALLSCAMEKKCQTVKINSQEIQTLQTELLLVYLCLHGAKHGFERIEWICDIDRLVRSTEVNWEEAVRIAEQSHSKRPFHLGLSLAHTLLHTDLPQKMLKSINSNEIKRLQAITLKQMSEKKRGRSDFTKNRETFFYQSRLFDRKSDMFRFYFSTFFKISTTDCQTFVLPEKLKFLYVVLRPLRLVGSYMHRFFVTRNA